MEISYSYSLCGTDICDQKSIKITCDSQTEVSHPIHIGERGGEFETQREITVRYLW